METKNANKKTNNISVTFNTPAIFVKYRITNAWIMKNSKLIFPTNFIILFVKKFFKKLECTSPVITEYNKTIVGNDHAQTEKTSLFKSIETIAITASTIKAIIKIEILPPPTHRNIYAVNIYILLQRNQSHESMEKYKSTNVHKYNFASIYTNKFDIIPSKIEL